MTIAPTSNARAALSVDQIGEASPRLLVSVITPSRDEIEHIESFLETLAAQRCEEFDLEFLIADGCSGDGTREILDRHAASDPRFRVLRNPLQRIAPALNIAIRAASGEIVVRMDVHTRYPTDYVARCVRVLEESGADNVGGAWIARGETLFERAVAAVFASRLASGGAPCRRPGLDGPVESVYLGCWWRSAFDRFGFFDESLHGNEDDEFNLGMRRRGGVVLASPRIRSWYRPRSNVAALFRQHVGYGFWKVGVMRRHRSIVGWRHLAPATLVFALILSIASSPWIPFASLLPATYLTAVLIGTAAIAIREGSLRLWPAMAVAVLAMHLGYGVGTILGVVRADVGEPTRTSPTPLVAARPVVGSLNQAG